MKIKISDKHTVEYLNGYYITYENAVHGPESKKAGEVCYRNHKTYAKLTGALTTLKLEGECEDVVKKGFDDSYKDYQMKESAAYLKKKVSDAESKAKKKEK